MLQTLVLAKLKNRYTLKQLTRIIGRDILLSSGPEFVRNWAASIIQEHAQSWIFTRKLLKKYAATLIESAYIQSLARWRTIRVYEQGRRISCYSWDHCYHISSFEVLIRLADMPRWSTQVIQIDIDEYEQRLVPYPPVNTLHMWITRYESEYSIIMNQNIYIENIAYEKCWWFNNRLQHTPAPECAEMKVLCPESSKTAALSVYTLTDILLFLT